MISALADLINRRPWRVLAVALAITVIAAPLGIHVRDHLKPRGFDVAGSGSAKAREIVARASGTDPANSVLALVRLDEPLGSPSSRHTIGTVEQKLGHDPAVAAVLDWRTAHNPAMVSRDRRSTYLVAALRPLDDEQQEEAGKRLLASFAPDEHVTLGGNPIANEEISKTIEEDLRRAELLALPLIVLLSFFLFRGFVASLLAPIAGGITVLVSFFLLRELASITSLSIYALNLVTGLSIGLSIDWSLLLLSRYREERAKTADLQLALRRALIPAGHTIFFSAITVAASMATLLVFPLRFLRSMGYGGIVASTVAMLVALVVLPTILRLLGGRIDALTLPRWRDPRRLAQPGSFWRGLGRLSTERAVPVATLVIVLMLAVATPFLRVRWTTVDASSLPPSAQAYQADQAINRSNEFVPNGGTPFYLVLRAPPSAGQAPDALVGEIRSLEGVRAVAPPRPLRDRTWQINLIAADTPYSEPTQTLVRELSTLKSPYPFFIGGDAAAFRDERNAISSRLPLAIALLAVATLIILFLLSGSLVAPLLALLMNALTLAAAFGALILIFQDGRFESLLSYTSQGALDLTIPLVLAALVFAISTDYGVFLLSRVREARLEGRTDREAISGSVATVGRIVTSAAILFAASIGVFGISDIVVLKILGFGTAIAVLADALLVRCLLLPSTLTLLGHRAWWLPSPLRRLHQRIGLHEEDHLPGRQAIPESAAAD
ncbi:MAG TPA: MMPL family transporter [Gaiellaceae bacterium]|jgi:RND superfamily putative drug exporter|nr:MMPL family transporter [Gaiellaceae bacterium]